MNDAIDVRTRRSRTLWESVLSPYSATSNRTPCARGKSPPQLIVQVCRLIYDFHESEPASLPPPVSFSPPNAPPISAPDVPILTLAMPQSLPRADKKVSPRCRLLVKIADDKP